MEDLMEHTAEDLLAAALVQLGLGSAPPSTDWPVYLVEPDTPDNVLTVSDTVGVTFARTATDSIRTEYPGFQIRVRGATKKLAKAKALAIAEAFDRDVLDVAVNVAGVSYVIESVNRTGSVLPLGRETPTSKRHVFTINGLAIISKVQA